MRMALFLLVVAACSSESPTIALFSKTGDDFYALPFPNDLRREADGTIDLSEFPTNAPLVDTYRMAADQLDGFGMNSPVFARFSDALDPTTLPTPAASMADGASVYLVDPATGAKTPIIATFRAEGTQTIGVNTLIARPYPGFGLMDATTYALVITTAVRDQYGSPIATTDEFQRTLANAEEYTALAAYLDGNAIARSTIASAAVFTTQRATRILPAIRDAIMAIAAPVGTDIVPVGGSTGLVEYTGSYVAPNFQRGTVPYHDAGDIVVGADGKAVIQRMETLRFSIAIPEGTMPATGWPVAIYSHGTGGGWESYLSDGTGSRLAQQGIATISMDQVLHGPRNPGGDPEIDFFNYSNPLAARDNALQGAADAFSQHRLVENLVVDGATFDASKVYFFGHSQGGVTGAGYVAFEPNLGGAVLSGTAGNLTLALLGKTEPANIPDLVTTLVRDKPIDENNPSLALVQMWMERADPINYAPLMVRSPVAGPRNVFQTEGFPDHYTPNPAIEAFATALGADIANNPDHKDIEGIMLRGKQVLQTPITNNAGSVTCVLAQFNQATSSDGHFVVFEVPLAETQAAQFLGTLARTGSATVVSM
jgi:hypothetical protein